MTDWIALHADLRRAVAAHERRIDRESRARFNAVLAELRAGGYEITPAAAQAIDEYLAAGEALIREGIEEAAGAVAAETIR